MHSLPFAPSLLPSTRARLESSPSGTRSGTKDMFLRPRHGLHCHDHPQHDEGSTQPRQKAGEVCGLCPLPLLPHPPREGHLSPPLCARDPD